MSSSFFQIECVCVCACFFLHSIQCTSIQCVCIPLAIVNVNDFHFCSSQLCWWSLTFLYALQMWFDPKGRKTTLATAKATVTALAAVVAYSSIRGKSVMLDIHCMHCDCDCHCLSSFSTALWYSFFASKITHCITFCSHFVFSDELLAFQIARRFEFRWKVDGYELKNEK